MIKQFNHLILTAPASQQSRAALIRRAAAEGRHADAVYSLILAANATQGSQWAERCAEVTASILGNIESGGNEQQRVFIAALLGIYGQRYGRDRAEIDNAVLLANTHLLLGTSAAGAISEAWKLLRNGQGGDAL